jgi:hypothetical protein
MRPIDALVPLLVFGALVCASPARAQLAPNTSPYSLEYLQYGVAFVSETQASGGDVCPKGAEAPCILGSGGGLAIRVAYRSRGPWLVGGAYQFSRHDSSNLLRLAILQQLRGEARYYWDRGTRLTPYAAAAFGGLLYGSEWGAETGGLVVSLGGGLEFQITQSTVVGFAPMYRAYIMRGFIDSAGQERADRTFGFGLAHFVGLELCLGIREPLPRW